MKIIPSSKLRVFAFVLSLICIAAGFTLFFLKGFNLGVDFESGISEVVKINSDNVNISDVRSALDGIKARVQRVGDIQDSTFSIRTSADTQEARKEIEDNISNALNQYFGEDSFEVVSSAFIGSKFSSSLITTSILGVCIALLIILIYIWFRFKFVYSISAVITLIHDVLLLLTFIIGLRIEISSITIAGILTIIGYSLNNTIVIFDRIRENVSLGIEKDLKRLINLSITQSLTRTLFSSLTTLAVIIPLGIFVVDSDIKMFSLILTAGIIIGIYSSMLIAGNILCLIAKGKVLSLAKK